MHAILLTALTATLIFGAISSAAAQTRPRTRAVQLISLTTWAGDGEPRERTETPQVQDVTVPQAAAFAIHDLSRQWVGFQMRAFAQTPLPPVPAGVDPENPFARIDSRSSQESPTAKLASVSSITVPAWMQNATAMASNLGRYVPACAPAAYRPSGILKPWEEIRRQAYFQIMSQAACEYGLPVGLFDAMIIRESRYNATIASPKNAYGLAQLMAPTATELGVDRLDAEGNLRGGAAYLRRQLDRFGEYHLALGAYNAGPKRIRDGMLPNIRETQDYVADILLNWSKLSGVQRGTVNQTPGSDPAVPSFGRAAITAIF